MKRMLSFFTLFVVIASACSIGFAEKDSDADATSAKGESVLVHPAIADYGAVVPLPSAAHQPRSGSRIVVDITKGGGTEKLNEGIEKVARFVNIYAGAGKEPASVDIAVVLHGDATLTILDDAAWTKRFTANTNPNLHCIRELQAAGVKFYVCGQSLIQKGGKPEEVIDDVSVAVSALTSLVNLQSDGYAYLPLLK